MSRKKPPLSARPQGVEPPVETSSRPRRERTQRTPYNISELGDVTERASYLATEALADEEDDKDPAWDEPKIEELKSHVLEHALIRERQRQIEGRLTTKGGQHGIGSLTFDDGFDHLGH